MKISSSGRQTAQYLLDELSNESRIVIGRIEEHLFELVVWLTILGTAIAELGQIVHYVVVV